MTSLPHSLFVTSQNFVLSKIAWEATVSPSSVSLRSISSECVFSNRVRSPGRLVWWPLLVLSIGLTRFFFCCASSTYNITLNNGTSLKQHIHSADNTAQDSTGTSNQNTYCFKFYSVVKLFVWQNE